MVMRERGIGNLPFIAVLVLLVVAVALFFLKQDEADNFRNERDRLANENATTRAKFITAQNAYEALLAVVGVPDEQLNVQADSTFPEPSVVQTRLREWLWGQAETIGRESIFKISTKNYTVQDEKLKILETQGEEQTIQGMFPTQSKDNITFKGFIDPLADYFKSIGKIAHENNAKWEEELAKWQSRITALEQANGQNKTAYDNDVAAKGAQADQLRNDLSSARDSITTLTTQYDAIQTENSTIKADADRQVREISRDRDAWKNRAISEKERKELAMAEDPKDGEVLLASRTRNTVFIDRGRKHRVSLGTRFTVWRPGKGNVRQDIAVIQVIKVDDTKSEARIIKVIDPRSPVTAGMNISNPFYDPFKKLRVHIYGDLKSYTTDIAKKQLAANNVTVVDKLDDTVDVIILGEPSVVASEEVEDEADIASANLRRDVDRAKRLNDVMDKAVAIGAIVVTEEVLRTFIEY